MMIIVITLPYFFYGEARHIVQLLQSSVSLVHIRKPQSTEQELERLICEIPAEYHNRLVLHDHHSLAVKYGLYGVHLNSRNPVPPAGWKGSVSRSCHTLDEVKEWKSRCHYVSLSPIFDSVSKKGYKSAFTHEELLHAQHVGIVDSRVMALGGVTFGRMDEVLRLGFGGGMILGDAWKEVVAHESLQPVALTIAGSDPCAGAGIQQDLKTMTAVGVYGATVITAVTSQNTMGVSGVLAMPPETVASQVEAVLSDLNVVSVKIGMVPNAAIARVIAEKIKEYLAKNPCCSVVYDPVMVSSSGKYLMQADCISTVCSVLFPLCTLVTPNLPEISMLLHHEYSGEEDGIWLTRKYSTSFLLKGGHGSGDILLDILFEKDKLPMYFHTPKISSNNLHGTGCTLSSAIASYLLLGHPLAVSIQKAKQLLAQGIARGCNARIGKGNGPLVL